MRTFVMLALACALAAPVLAADLGTLQADSATATAWSVDAACDGAQLRALHSGDGQGATLRILATSAAVVQDVRTGGLTVAGLETQNRPSTPPRQEYSAATATGTRAGDTYGLDLAASGVCWLHAQGDTASVAAAGPFTGQDRTPGDQAPLAADVQHSVAVTSPATVVLTVHGDLALSLWDWDIHIEGSEGQASVPSGRHQFTMADAAGVDAAGWTQSSQTYLFLRNATVDIQVAGQSTLFVHGAVAQAGRVELAGTTGTVQTPDGPTRADGPVDLLGPLTVGLDRSGSRMGVSIRSPAQAQLDGHAIHVAPTQVPAWLAATGLVAGGLALVLAARAAWLRRCLALARRRMRLLDDHGVLRATRALLRSRRHRAGAAVLACVALVRLGQHDRAAVLVRAARSWPGAVAPTLDYLEASILAADGDSDGAAALLARAVAAAPGLAAEAGSNFALRKARKLAGGPEVA